MILQIAGDEDESDEALSETPSKEPPVGQPTEQLDSKHYKEGSLEGHFGTLTVTDPPTEEAGA